MSSCPDINRLIDSLSGDGPDRKIGTHLEECASCRADLRLLREIRAAFRPEIEVPEHLSQRVLEDISLLELPAVETKVPTVQVFGSGLLGSLTAIAAIVVTGLVGNADPGTTLLFSVVAGGAACVVRILRGNRWMRA